MSLARAINPQNTPVISLVLADDLMSEIATIPLLLEQMHNKKIRMVDVADTMDRINLLLASEECCDKRKIFLEQFKLAILQAVNKHLNDLSYYQKPEKHDPEIKPAGFWYWVKVGFMSLVALIGLTENAVMTFLGARVLLLSFFPAIPVPALLTVTILFTIINVVQFIAFQVGTLKTMFGVSSPSNLKKIMESHEQQIKATAEINHSLADVNILCNMTKKEFMQFKKIAVKCNQDVEVKKTTYHEYIEHPAKKVLRLGFTGFGAIMSVVGSYFGATMFLTTMAPAMLGTPIGWLIIGGLVISSVVFYFAMQAKGLRDMFNPLLKVFDNIKNQVDAFNVVTDAEFNYSLMNDNIFKPSDSPDQHNKNIHALDLAAVPNRKIVHDSKMFSRSRSVPAIDECDNDSVRMSM